MKDFLKSLFSGNEDSVSMTMICFFVCMGLMIYSIIALHELDGNFTTVIITVTLSGAAISISGGRAAKIGTNIADSLKEGKGMKGVADALADGIKNTDDKEEK